MDVLVDVAVEVDVCVAVGGVVAVGPPGVLVAVGVPGVFVADGDSVAIGVFVAVGVNDGVAVPAGPSSIMKLSKFVSQPFELPIVTGLQMAVQFVFRIACWPAARAICAVVWPTQLALTLLVTVPPLNAATWIRRFGVRNVNGAVVGPTPLKPMLVVVKAPYGPEMIQRLVPQSMTPIGYCPFTVAPGSSNVIVCAPTTGVDVAVGEPAVGVAVAVVGGAGAP